MIQRNRPMERPSHSELLGKILKARGKLSQNDWAPASLKKLLPELKELDLWTTEEQSLALATAANEIRPEDYAGTRPPQESYEDPCEGAELFAFRWDSKHFKKRMYLKFCFVKETLYVVSCHEHRDRKGRAP
jgi:hypothetical protein